MPVTSFIIFQIKLYRFYTLQIIESNRFFSTSFWLSQKDICSFYSLLHFFCSPFKIFIVKFLFSFWRFHYSFTILGINEIFLLNLNFLFWKSLKKEISDKCLLQASLGLSNSVIHSHFSFCQNVFKVFLWYLSFFYKGLFYCFLFQLK